MAIQGNTVRSLSPTNDWTYGTGDSGYLTGNPAIRQQIQCRLLQFFGECFWDTQAGINWFGYLGSKNSAGALKLAISTVILNSFGVTALNAVSFVTDDIKRTFTISWDVSTIYSTSFPGQSTFSLTGA